jgi:predicted Zn-dependent protease with MMP-like domain
LQGGCRASYRLGMVRAFGVAPTAEEIEALARAALGRLPAQFAAHLGDVVLQVEDFADEELLAALGIESPFELTGVYEGLPLHEKSIGHSGTMPDRIRLFRGRSSTNGPNAETRRSSTLVAHVLVHEVGHHFGLSDETMHALEERVG